MMSQSLYRLGRLSARRPWVVIGSWLVLAVVVVGASSALGRPLKDSLQVPGLDSQQATELMADAGAGDAGLTAQVVVTPLADDATFFGSAEARSALEQLQVGAAALPHVLSVHPGVVSADGRVALIRLQYPPVDQLSAKDLSNLKAFGADAAAGSPLRIEMGGDLYLAFEQSQPGLGELIGLLVAALIVFLAFGSVVATAVPIGTAVLGLAIGVSSMSLIANVIDIPSWAPVLGAMVGLGVGIDYALFIVTRHRDCLARGVPVEDSVASAVATAGKPVVVAGGIVVVAILGLVVAGVPFMTAGGIAISVVVLVMVGASVTLLPALARPGGAPHQPPVAPSRPRQRRRSGPPGLVEVDRARDPKPVALRGGGHRALARPGRARGGAACRHPRRRRAAAEPDRAPGLRPGDPGVRPGEQRALVVAVDLAGDRAVLDPLVTALRDDRGIASVGIPGCIPTPVWLSWSPSRRPGPRTLRRTRQSSGCAPTYCPEHSHRAPRRHTSVARRPTSPTSAHASTSGSPC